MVPPFGPRERAARRERLLFELTQLHPLVRVEIDVGVLTHRANGRVRPVNGHDELLSRPCSAHGPAPVVRSPGQEKRSSLTTTRPMSGWTQSFPRTWVTPRCASASIPRGPRRLLRSTHAAAENTTCERRPVLTLT